MSVHKQVATTFGLRFAGFADAIYQDAINQDLINQRVGVYVNWLSFAMTRMRAANAVLGKAFGVSSNAFLEIHWYLFAAVLSIAAANSLQRNEHVRVGIQRGEKLHPYIQGHHDRRAESSTRPLRGGIRRDSGIPALVRIMESFLLCVISVVPHRRSIVQQLHGRSAKPFK
jgi:hypothetical protein